VSVTDQSKQSSLLVRGDCRSAARLLRGTPLFSNQAHGGARPLLSIAVRRIGRHRQRDQEGQVRQALAGHGAVRRPRLGSGSQCTEGHSNHPWYPRPGDLRSCRALVGHLVNRSGSAMSGPRTVRVTGARRCNPTRICQPQEHQMRTGSAQVPGVGPAAVSHSLRQSQKHARSTKQRGGSHEW